MNNTGCLDLNLMPQISQADFSVLKSHVISAHYRGIETESLLCVFVCHFLSSLVHKNSAKWAWFSHLLRKSFNFEMAMHFQMLYLQSSHWCVIYGNWCVIPVTWLLPCQGEEAGYPPVVHRRIQALHQPCQSNSSTKLTASCPRSSRSPGTYCSGVIS